MKKLFSIFLATAIGICGTGSVSAEDIGFATQSNANLTTVTQVEWHDTYSSLKEMIEDSDVCIVGTVVSQMTETHNGMYFTHSYIQADDEIYDVLQTGAMLNGNGINIPYDTALMNVNSEYFLCLKQEKSNEDDAQYYLIAGGNQGYGIYNSESETVSDINLSQRSLYRNFLLDEVYSEVTVESIDSVVSIDAITPRKAEEYYWSMNTVTCYVMTAIGNTYGSAVDQGICAGVTSWNSTNAPYITAARVKPAVGISVTMGDYGATGWDAYTTTTYQLDTKVVTDAKIYLSTHYLSSYLTDSGLWAALCSHEMGHALGLDHNDTVTASIMRTNTIAYYNYSGSSPRYTSPQSVDIAGVNMIYG